MENEREEGPTGLEDYGILIHDQETVQLPRNLMEPLQSTRPRFAPESVVLRLMIRLASIGGTGVGRRLWGKGFAISTRRLLRPVGQAWMGTKFHPTTGEERDEDNNEEGGAEHTSVRKALAAARMRPKS